MASLLLLYARERPFLTHDEWRVVSDDVVSQVHVLTAVSNYRELSVNAPAYLPFLQQTPTPIQVGAGWTALVSFLTLIGWSALLAAFTRIGSFWGYPILFLFACHLYLARFGAVLVGNTDFLLAASAVLVLIFLVPAYLIQVRILRFSVSQSFLLFALIQAALYFTCYKLAGVSGLYEVTWAPVVVLFVVFIFALLLLSKDLSAIAVYLATNARQEERRLAYGGTLIVLAAVTLLCGLAFAQAFDFLPREGLVIRPWWLLAPAAVLTVFTTQNAYFQVADLIPSPIAYISLLLGMTLLLLSLLLGAWAFAEHSLTYQLERITAASFFAVSLVFWVYVAANFRSRLRKRLNIFYVLMFARVFRFEVIWMLSIAALVALEGAYSWRSYQAIACVVKNVYGDLELASGEAEQALLWYDQAAGFMPHDVKSNYNSAHLYISSGSFYQEQTHVNRIVKLLRASDNLGQFPMGAATLALFMQVAKQPEKALELLQERPKAVNDPKLDAMRGVLFYETSQPDSAIHYFKNSLEAEPRQPHLFLNLAHLYLAYGRPEEATKHFSAAYRLDPNDPFVRQARYFMALERPDGAIKADGEKPILEPAQYPANMNLAWLAMSQKQYKLADTLAGSLLQQAQRPDLYLLRMAAQAFMDSVNNAVSRYYWIAENHPEYKGQAAHTLAVYFHSKGMPEMAVHLFGEAATAGIDIERVNQAFMWADLGLHDKAYRELAVCRSDFPDVEELVRREMALIDFAHGTEARFLPWDFKGITYLEAMRGGVYGRQADNNAAPALLFYQPLVDRDSSLTDPYLEMGRIYVNLKDYETGVLQYQFGLERDPKNVRLRAELARGYALSGQLNRADSILNAMSREDGKHPEALRVAADIAAQNGRIDEAIKNYEELIAMKPFDRDAYLAVAPLYEKKKSYERGMRMLGRALAYNKKHPQLWRWYAVFSFEFGLRDDAMGALDQAVELAFTESDRQGYARLRNELQIRDQQ